MEIEIDLDIKLNYILIICLYPKLPGTRGFAPLVLRAPQPPAIPRSFAKEEERV